MTRFFMMVVLIMGIAAGASAQLQFKNSSNQVVMHIAQSGEVGINTTSPGTYKLRVSGSARTDALNINNAYNLPTTRSAGFLKADAASNQTVWADVFTGTVNRVAKFTGSGNTIGNSQIRDEGDRMAIAGPTETSTKLKLHNTNGNELLFYDSSNLNYCPWVAFDLYRHVPGDYSSGYIALFTTLPRDVDFALVNNPTEGVDKSMNLLVDGNVGIKTGYQSTWDFNFKVMGSAWKSEGGSTWNTTSDERLKNIEEPYQHGLSDILQIEPIKFSYKEGNPEGLNSDLSHIGLNAQQVEKVIPEAVSVKGNGYLSLNADPVIWAMLNAIKELDAKNEKLRAEIEALKAR